MDCKIKELVNHTRNKFCLTNYYLKNFSLHRNVTIYEKTINYLTMEWFPNEIYENKDLNLNPKGTAVIDIDIQMFRNIS